MGGETNLPAGDVADWTASRGSIAHNSGLVPVLLNDVFGIADVSLTGRYIL